MQQQKTNTDKYGWRVPEWGAAVGISRSSVYELIQENTIASVRFGGSRIITTHPRDFLARLSDGAAA